MLKYKNYTAHVTYEDEAKVFFGVVDNIGDNGDVITFRSEKEEEIEKKFQEMIDFYLGCCANDKTIPARPFMGKIVLRASPTLHQEIYIKAKQEGVSLNQLAVKAIDHYLHCNHG